MPADELRIGAIFADRFRVEAILGSGGFATVYKARDERSGQIVALKISHEGLTDDPRTRARFDREVRAAEKLQGRHVARLLDSGVDADGYPFTVSELLGGEDLSTTLDRDGKFTLERAVHLARQVLLALDEAHQHGLVHRDVKPENIRLVRGVDGAEEAKLMDFGIAKPELAEGPAVTKTGELVGTPRYMAPEQLRGEPATPATDVYSLGIVLVEMLRGRDAMHGWSMTEQVARLADGGIPLPASAAPIGHVLQRMLALESSLRFQSAAAAEQALGRTLSDPHEYDGRSASPVKASSGAGGLVALVVVGLGVAAAVFLMNPAPPPTVPPTAPPTATLTPPAAPAGHAPRVEVSENDDPDVPADTSTAGDEANAEDIGKGGCDANKIGERRVADYTADLPGTSQTTAWTVISPAVYDHTFEHPVVITLTAAGVNHKSFVRNSGFVPLTDEHRFIVIGVKPHIDRWKSEARLTLLPKILDEVAADYCIDRKRVFAVGHIAGGRYAAEVSCDDTIAGVAVASSRPNDKEPRCTPIVPKAALLLSPTKTDHSPIEGGVNCHEHVVISLAEHENLWKERNGCRGKARKYFEHGDSRCVTWTCTKAPLVSCRIDGGHNWPGAPMRLLDIHRRCDGPASGFPSAEVTWKFFLEQVGP